LAKLTDSPLFVALAFINRVECRNSDFKKFICDDLATYGPVTPEFKRVKGVHSVVDQQFVYEATLLDIARISTEFSGAITTFLEMT